MIFYKSKTELLTSLWLFMWITLSKANHIVEATQLQCRFPISQINNQTHTILLDIENNTNMSLKDCLLRGCSFGQSVLLIKRRIPKTLTINKLIKFMKKNPNIVFTTTTLHPNILQHPVLNFFLDFQWSLFYIIVTVENKSLCEKSKYTEEIYMKAENFLNDLWYKYRIINVVLTFPFACPYLFITYDGKKYSGKELYDRTTQIVYVETLEELSTYVRKSAKYLTDGYPMRANIFDRFPTAVNYGCAGIQYYVNIKQFNYTDSYCGIDGLTLQDIVKHFNFNLSLPKLGNDSHSHGYVKKDGTITGSLGYVVRKEIDVSFNSRFMVPYLDRGFTFLNYISHDLLCIMLKRPDIIPLWHFPYNVYDVLMWLLLCSILIVLGVLTWLAAKITNTLSGGIVHRLQNYILDSIFSGFFGFFLIEKTSKFFILRGSCLLFSIILLATYQGHVNYVFTTQVRYNKIKTFEEIHKSNIVIHTSASILNLLNSPPNERQKKVMSHVYEYKGNSSEGKSFEYVIEHPHTGTIERRSDVILETIKYYSDQYGSPKLYVVDECLQSYYLSFIVTEGFPFVDHINSVLQHLIAGGFPDKYYEWTQRTLLGLMEISPASSSEPRPTSKVTLQENCIAFGLLLTGYVLSTAVFIYEKWWAKNECVGWRTNLVTY